MAKSVYAENFIIKGGILITSLVGVSMRSTMDIDTSIRGFTLSQEEALRVVREISEIDISTGDVITPEAVKYDYKLMLEERSILVWSYNLETILAEKLQTVMYRGILNTRMRDYYDIYTLMLRYENDLSWDTLKQAFNATCKERNTTDLDVRGAQIFDIVMHDNELHSLWNAYQKKYICRTI